MSQAVDNSTRALAQTGAQLQKLLVALPATVDAQLTAIQENANLIADQALEVEANKKAIEAQVRDAAAEVRLQVKEDKESVLTDLLGEFGLTGVKPEALRELNQRVETAEFTLKQAEWHAVDAAVKSANAAAASKLQTVESNHKVEIATLYANAARDSDLIAALRKQVESLEATLVAQRDAETERTKALAQSSVTVNTAGR